MMKRQTLNRAIKNPFIRVALLCLISLSLQAADKQSKALQLLDHDADRVLNASELNAASRSARGHPGTSLILAPISGGFEFDLGGSEIPKLQLQLAHPLRMSPDFSNHNPSPAEALGLGASLTVPIGRSFALHGRTERATSLVQNQPQYQSLGNIRCLNGTLRPDSYTASGCRFVDDEAVTFDSSTLSLGASAEMGAVSGSINWFTSQSSSGQGGLNPTNRVNQATLFDPIQYSESALNRILPGLSSAAALESEASGVDLNFQVGFTTDLAGEVQLGLALTHVYDAHLNSPNRELFTPLAWSHAEPFNAASLGIEFKRGAFSGGVRAYYRDPIDFLDRQNPGQNLGQSLDSLGTFDVHFTWRAPWNANFSVGASNALGAGTEDRRSSEEPAGADRFESIYGRIPYVRYQQDL